MVWKTSGVIGDGARALELDAMILQVSLGPSLLFVLQGIDIEDPFPDVLEHCNLQCTVLGSM
jgi:hypothetical protein